MSELAEKVKASVERMKAFAPPEGYLLAFSGGKDSVVLKALADMAGVKYQAHYNVTSVDPPELIYFIREKYPDVRWEYPRYDDGKRITMRLGCIGCPMAGKHRKVEFERWPRYKQLYLNAFARMQDARVAAGKLPFLGDKLENPTVQDVFDWWMEEPWIPGQMSMWGGGHESAT